MKTEKTLHQQPTQGNSNWKNILTPAVIRYFKVALFTFIGIFILWLITRNQDISKIWHEFRNANFFWILLALTSNIISHIVRAVRWNLLISPVGEKPKTSTTFYALMTGYLANLAVPRLGEITRCVTLARYSKVPFNALAGTVVAERVFDMVTLLGLIFLTIIFQFNFLREFLDQYIFTPFTGLVGGNLWVLIIAGLVVMFLFLLFLRYLKGINSQNMSFSGKLKRQAIGFWKGLISLVYLKHKFQFLFLSLLIWFLYFLMVYLVFFALPGTSFLGVADGFTILTMGSLGVVAPVPGGVGTYHFIVIATMTELLSVNLEAATSYAYITHAVQTLIVLVLGGLSYLILSMKFKLKKKQSLAESENSHLTQ